MPFFTETTAVTDDLIERLPKLEKACQVMAERSNAPTDKQAADVLHECGDTVSSSLNAGAGDKFNLG